MIIKMIKTFPMRSPLPFSISSSFFVPFWFFRSWWRWFCGNGCGCCRRGCGGWRSHFWNVTQFLLSLNHETYPVFWVGNTVSYHIEWCFHQSILEHFWRYICIAWSRFCPHFECGAACKLYSHLLLCGSRIFYLRQEQEKREKLASFSDCLQIVPIWYYYVLDTSTLPDTRVWPSSFSQ